MLLTGAPAPAAANMSVRVDVSRIASQIVTGISFLGAGVIVLHKRFVMGLTTAATIWTTAAIGVAVGGGLYAVGDGIAAAYAEGGRAVIRELLAPAGADRRALAASLAAHLQTGEALLYTADPAGEPYLSAAPGSLPADTVWGLSFD